MITTFTRDDIVRYVYQETTEEESVLIEQTLLTEADLQQFYEELVETKNDLDRLRVFPSDQTIQNILAYSRNFPNVQSEYHPFQ
jgi:hypothetical protein